MRNRDYKDFSKGSIYHLFNRGNNKERIFFDEQDYKSILYRLGLALGVDQRKLNDSEITAMPKSRVRILGMSAGSFNLHAFCFMPNHFHLLIEQVGDVSISKMMSKFSTSYAMYINKKYRRVGNIFQDCFKSVLIEDNTQLMWVVSYIHMNPVKDGVVASPYDYIWSSYNDFASDRNLPIVSKELVPTLFENRENFIQQNFILSKDVSRGILDSTAMI